MRRPQDPRNHGLKEPKKVYTKKEEIRFPDSSNLEELTDNGKILLQAVVGAWQKALKDHESQGHRIVVGPYIESGERYYNHSVSLTYTYEWDNFNYSVEKAEFDVTMAKYLEDLKYFQEAEEGKKSGPPPNIDEKIARAEQRLANLKAAKAGEPLPYPEG